VSVRSSKENGFGGRCANARRIADQDIKRVEQACFATTTLGGMNEEVWSVVELVYQIGVDDPERDQPIERIVLEEYVAPDKRGDSIDNGLEFGLCVI
jgi:hypothetical protein